MNKYTIRNAFEHRSVFAVVNGASSSVKGAYYSVKGAESSVKGAYSSVKELSRV